MAQDKVRYLQANACMYGAPRLPFKSHDLLPAHSGPQRQLRAQEAETAAADGEQASEVSGQRADGLASSIKLADIRPAPGAVSADVDVAQLLESIASGEMASDQELAAALAQLGIPLPPPGKGPPPKKPPPPKKRGPNGEGPPGPPGIKLADLQQP